MSRMVNTEVNGKSKCEPRVLSIQSHVVRGYVGNKSATFPLQVLGFEVDAINTVQFSNHSGYKHLKGQVISGSDIKELMEGLSLNNINDYTHLLTGYTRSTESLNEVAVIVKKLRAENPGFMYVCDPVMGDDGVMYVPEEILPAYRNIIVPLADILTPNQYEAELLTDMKIKTISDARKAIDKLHKMGTKIVILSSSDLGDEKNMLSLASTINGDCYAINIPKISIHFTGTGDLFASLMLSWTFKTNYDIKSSLEKTIATMQHILNDTAKRARDIHGDVKMSPDKVELRLIQNKKAIENPNIEITAYLVDQE